MAKSNLPVIDELPALDGLIEQLKAAFAQHIEIEDGAKARVLRVAGLELVVTPSEGTSRAMLGHVCERLAEVAAFGLATALTNTSAAGTRQRMALVSALALIEASTGAAPTPGTPRSSDSSSELLTTVEVATQLGMSRPYVSMLCDQGKLGEVTRSQGGHRRILKSAVEHYRRTHCGPLQMLPALDEDAETSPNPSHHARPLAVQKTAVKPQQLKQGPCQ